MEYSPPMRMTAALLVAFFLAFSAATVCLAAGRGGVAQPMPYKPQNIFRNADNDPAVGIGSFIPGDGYGMGPFIGSVPVVGFVPATPHEIEASGSTTPTAQEPEPPAPVVPSVSPPNIGPLSAPAGGP
ncbi:hypothetical protein Taro_041341 [Colocasia esculenta]|uniref:Uncharacterized protein n=1 Tax=Colocasia esculenta TaxID=4460 RepID=A0A843WB87_COLES|nr:hypothetical protein [Colocasia esculenta]